MSAEIDRLRALLDRVVQRAGEPRNRAPGLSLSKVDDAMYEALLPADDAVMLGADDVVADDPESSTPEPVAAVIEEARATTSVPEESFADVLLPELIAAIPVAAATAPLPVAASLLADAIPPELGSSDVVDDDLAPASSQSPRANVHADVTAKLRAVTAADLASESLLELDERHIVHDWLSESVEVPVAVEPELQQLDAAPVSAPLSSRRPRPLDELPEPKQPHPEPPESGRLMAMPEVFDLEDELGSTGVRAAHRSREADDEQMAIPLAPIAIEVVEAAPPVSRNWLELDLPAEPPLLLFAVDAEPEPAAESPAEPARVPVPAASEIQLRHEPEVSIAPVITLLPRGPTTDSAMPQVEVVHASLPTSEVAVFVGAVASPFVPRSFGELLDATLAL